MRLCSLLLALATAAVVAPPPAGAADPAIVVHVTRQGWADVTLPAAFDPDVATADYAPRLTRGRYAGFVAEPLGDRTGRHAFGIVSVRWPSTAVTNLRVSRRAETESASIFASPVGTVPLNEPEPAPAGRWRFHFFGDAEVTFTVPAAGLPGPVHARPRAGGTTSSVEIRTLALPASDGRIPFTVSGRSAVFAAVMAHHGADGVQGAAVCLAEAGGPCAESKHLNAFAEPTLQEWWETHEVMAAPGALLGGDYEAVHAVAAAPAYDAYAAVIVVRTP